VFLTDEPETTQPEAQMPQGGSDRVRDLIKAVEASDIEEVTVEDAGMRITIRKGGRALSDSGFVQAPFNPGSASPPAAIGADQATGVGQAPGVAVETPAPAVDDSLYRVTAPMVGTFYSAPSPNDSPYVEVGSHVQVGDVLCILEAMKLMNEVVSEVSGTVRGVLVADTQPVEYDQPLFAIELDQE
jgi:acetyl-CoA carboxylase biotin carboxyl carrier protein